MADQGIKNVIVKKDSLGKVTSSNGRVIRFRLVAEDKNRKSAWSQIFLVGSQAVLVLPGDTNVVGNTVLVNWSNGSNVAAQTNFDIFAGFDGDDPQYVGTSNNTSYSFLKDGIVSVRVIVQIASISPKLNQTIRVYDSGVRSLV